jgi:hypothetical protein
LQHEDKNKKKEILGDLHLHDIAAPLRCTPVHKTLLGKAKDNFANNKASL